MRRVNFQLAAAVVGYDGATTPGGASELVALLERTLKARPNAVQVVLGTFDLTSDAVREGLEARAEIKRRFYDLVLRSARATPGRLPGRTTCRDGSSAGPAPAHRPAGRPGFCRPDLAEREALFVLGAGVHTTAMYMIITLRELFELFAKHPGDRALVDDDQFLLGAAHEALRLNPLPLFFRRALADLDLSDGTHLGEGDLVGIEPRDANRDPEAYGPDAAVFNPRRLPRTTAVQVTATPSGPARISASACRWSWAPKASTAASFTS